MLKSKANKRDFPNEKVIGITLGDPAGIGPEVVAKALSKPSVRKLGKFILIGDAAVYKQYCPRNYANCSFLDCKSVSLKDIPVGKESALSGKASLAYLQKGVELLKKHTITSIATAPISKEAISRYTQKIFKGHTEFLAESFGVERVEMMFVAKNLRLVIATRHIPIKDVPNAITKKNLYETILLTHQGLKKLFKIKNPKIGVCGLNPHAGEGGKMGKEEIEVITPVIKKAIKNKMRIEGPFAADTIFTATVYPRYDVIIAMYHDQGLIGAKTMRFNQLVNMTVGLPFVRTSTAHGTAYNIAGKDCADPSSMCEAIKLAASLTR